MCVHTHVRVITHMVGDDNGIAIRMNDTTSFFYCGKVHITRVTILTILNYTIQCHKLYSQCCAAITTI